VLTRGWAAAERWANLKGLSEKSTNYLGLMKERKENPVEEGYRKTVKKKRKVSNDRGGRDPRKEPLAMQDRHRSEREGAQ